MFLKHLNPSRLKHLHDAICKEHLGEGGFGSVELYQCKERCLGEDCNKCFVVKKMKMPSKYNIKYYLHGSDVVDKNIEKHFLQEYTIGILLEHPNIRQTLDIDIKSHSIIFEYCPGIDLLDYLNVYKSNNTKPLIKYFNQILDAVEYIHDMGIAHMDLKLENVVLNKVNDKIKIIDFGEAVVYKQFNKNVFYKGLNGTPEYMPPEMLTHKEYDPEKVDIWSCGIILYNLIYNKMPWERASASDFKYKLHRMFINNGKLHTDIFQDLTNYYTKTDCDIIKNVFKNMFQINPDNRKSISIIRQVLKLMDHNEEYQYILQKKVYNCNIKKNKTSVKF